MNDEQLLAIYHAAEAHLEYLHDALGIHAIKLRLATVANDGPPEPTDGSGPFGTAAMAIDDCYPTPSAQIIAEDIMRKACLSLGIPYNAINARFISAHR